MNASRVRFAGLLIIALVVLSHPAFAANKYWVGASGTTNAPTSGTWQATAPIVWSDGASGAANSTWADGDAAFFGGASGTFGIKVAGAINAASLRFLTSAYTLTSDTPQIITLSSVSTSVPKLTVAAGKTVTIGTNVTVDCPNSTWVGNSEDIPGGTISIESGGILEEKTGNTWALDGAGTILSVKTGGKQIASEMNLSMGTIRTYIRSMYEKLHVNSRTEAVVKYLNAAGMGGSARGISPGILQILRDSPLRVLIWINALAADGSIKVSATEHKVAKAANLSWVKSRHRKSLIQMVPTEGVEPTLP